jgi:hypothetical protein
MSNYNPYDDLPNYGGTGAGATTPGDDDFEAGVVTKAVTGAGSDTINTVSDTVLNIGPDWLDEAVIIGLVTVVIGVLLFLARPLLTIIAGVTD